MLKPNRCHIYNLDNEAIGFGKVRIEGEDFERRCVARWRRMTSGKFAGRLYLSIQITDPLPRGNTSDAI